MPAPAAKTRSTTKAKPEPRQRTKYRVRIRMYRHGLGDCILLSFRKKDGTDFHMMVDCGIVLGTSNPGAVMKKVAENVKEVTRTDKEPNGRLDVLVITHEHWDHLSGFDKKQAREIFAPMKIGALWLGWTEDEGDDLARSLREERETRKAAANAARKMAEARGLKAQAKRLAHVLGFFGAAAAGDDSEEDDGGGTAGALAFLKKKRKPTILKTGSSFPMPDVEDVRVYVLGPPRDAEAMRKTNPAKGEGYGLTDTPLGLAEAFLAGFGPNKERAQPFAEPMRLALPALQSQSQGSREKDPRGIAGYYAAASQWRNIDDAWLATSERLALQLDNATNNTSLVLAIELGGEDVLLVGDAQAGNWRSWEKCHWSVKGKDGEMREVDSADLLHRTVFYKVGHHGSHNATLREKGLELMKSDRLAAFIPVDTKVAHEVKGWVHMPLTALRERLQKKCAVIFQSDEKTRKKRGAASANWVDGGEQFDVFMKSKRSGKVEVDRQQTLYTDYFL